MADQGKLHVGVELDGSDAFSGFADAVLKEIRPALDQVQREMARGGAQSSAAFQQGMGQGASRFGGLGDVFAGSFLGSLGAQLVSKGLMIFEDFARRGASAVESILKGGFDRLTSIDTAKTKLEALGNSAVTTAEVMKDALAAVKGTAFGLQDAATVAASAVAAGVAPGKALTDYLKLTADTAAIARKAGADMGATFNEVGHVLNLVTTQGYATNQELQMLSDMGLPIYLKLSTNLHKATGEIIDMASKSGIAASDVRAALQDVVGGAALKMGESFEGGVENVKAALDRLGAALLQPFFEPTKQGIGTLTEAIDNLTKQVQANLPTIIATFGSLGQGVIAVGEAMSGLGVIVTSLLAAFFALEGGIIKAFLMPFKAIKEALDVVPDSMARLIPGFDDIRNGMGAVNNILDAGAEGILHTSDTFSNLTGHLYDLSTNTLPKAGESLAQYTERLAKTAQSNATFAESTKNMGTAIVNSLNPAIFQARMQLWQLSVQQYALTGGKSAAPGPAPVFGPTVPGWTPAAIPPSIASPAIMPPDVIKTTGGGGGGKADKPPLYPGGQLPAISGLPTVSSTPSLSSSYAVPAMGSIPIPGVSTQGLQPQSMAALQAIFQQFGGSGISLTSGFRATDQFEWHPSGRGLDIGIPNWDTPQGKAIGDQVNAWIQANKDLLGVYGTLWQVADHYNHVHVSIKDQISPLLAGGGAGLMPPAGLASMPGIWEPADPKQLREANDRIIDLENQIRVKEQRMREMRADVAESEKMAAEQEREKLYRDLDQAKADKAALEQGKLTSGKGSQFNFNDLPFGDPRKILAGIITGAGGSDADARAILGLGGAGMTGMPSMPFSLPPGTVPVAQVSTAPAGADWDAIAQKESGGLWNRPDGDRDSSGGLQIRQGTWDEFGGQEFAPSPYLASKEDQIKVAERILAKQGPNAWAGGKNFVPASPGMTGPGLGASVGMPVSAPVPSLAPAGVTPVFVTNMPSGGIPGAAPGAPGAPGGPGAGTPAGVGPAGVPPGTVAPSASATPSGMQGLVQPAVHGVAATVGGVAGDSLAAALTSTPGYGPLGGKLGVPTSPSTDLGQLLHERNPWFLAQAAGFNVPNYARFGGGASAQNLMVNGGPASDAMGRMYSDTAALIDRTFTNQDAAAKARHDQAMTVFNQVKDRLASDFVKPVTTAAVTAGIDGIGDATTTAIGQAMAAPIADAVATSMPSSSGSPGASIVNTGANMLTGVGQGVNAVAGFADGGAIIGPGTGTSDSILARVSHGEWVLTANQVRSMGGFRGVQSYLNTLPRFATGGGVDVSATVGAEFFGVSQLPIISTIVNLLVAVLLKVIGVTITARDTLNEISSDFREFRGDFKAYDAYGRMMNDTSGLIDRTGSSEQAAADERIRILKLVLEGLFKFIVEKIVVPIAKAVGNSLLQAASGALQGGLGAAFPGGSIVGGIAGSALTAGGQAGIDIAAEIGTILAESIFSVGADAIGQLLQSIFPGITTGVFGGGLLAMIVDPITGVLNSLFGGITTLFGGLLGGLSTLIPGLPFDEGGVAYGTGWLPKNTVRPERVLSPAQTASFDRLVEALSTGRTATTTIHAPFTVVGGERGGREARDRLLALMS